ncbi:MAG: GAF domain-containing sensor histidine kinase [Saprospiraceae bacterium]|nr:GAF domain-containing sensor histidine kinase [Saprospiraceae bacterium]
MEKSYINKEKLLEAISYVQSLFIQEKSIDDIFNKMLEVLLDVTKSEYGFIGEILNDGQQDFLKTHAITNIAWNDATQKFYDEKAPSGLEFKNLKTLFGRVITDRKAVVSNMPNHDPRRGGLPEGHPYMKSFLGVPIFYMDEFCGMFGIANRKGGYNDALIKEIEPIVVACGNLICGYRLIKQRNETRDLLEQSVTVLKDKNERLKEFTYIVSHDIRKHSANLKMIAELIDFEDDEQRDMSYKMMVKSIDHLSMTVDYISEIVDIDKDSSIPEIEINLAEFVNRIIDSYTIQTPDITIQNAISKDVQIKAKAGYVNSICENLISNAIQYKSANNAHLIISATETNEDITFIFKDNGLGMDLDKIGDRLFKMYATFHGNKEAKGLGLFLVKKYIEALKWKIAVESQEGKGTEFKILIPQKSYE